MSTFSRGRSIDEEDRTKDRLWRQVSMIIGIAKVRADGNNAYFFTKIEGYTPSGLGSRLFTVDRLADKNLLFFKIRKRAELAIFW